MWSIWMFTIPSLRAKECTPREKDALNILFLLVRQGQGASVCECSVMRGCNVLAWAERPGGVSEGVLQILINDVHTRIQVGKGIRARIHCLSLSKVLCAVGNVLTSRRQSCYCKVGNDKRGGTHVSFHGLGYVGWEAACKSGGAEATSVLFPRLCSEYMTRRTTRPGSIAPTQGCRTMSYNVCWIKSESFPCG